MVAEGLEAVLAVVVAYAAVSDAAEGEAMVGDVHDGVVDAAATEGDCVLDACDVGGVA